MNSFSRGWQFAVRGSTGMLVAAACAFGAHGTIAEVQPTSDTRPPKLSDVLERAGHYVVSYGASLATVLAEEEYTQRLVARPMPRKSEERRLRSEIAFITLVDSSEWLAFRNVLSVDGKAVPDSEHRLERLFRDPPTSLLAQVRLIASESARYNLGPITREINVPTTALHFLEPTHQRDCKFEKTGEELIGNERAWKIRYQERDSGAAYIRRADGRRLLAEGHLWIVPADGRVVRTELLVKEFLRGVRASRAIIGVTWRHDPGLDLWVPSDLREHYEWPNHDIDGVATYSNYRRFRVDVRIK